jgi:hypothetical protein
MRPTTTIWIELVNVGSPLDRTRLTGTLKEVMPAILKWLLDKTMNNHMRIIVARSQAELEKTLTRKASNTEEDVMDEFNTMLAGLGLNLDDSTEAQ